MRTQETHAVLLALQRLYSRITLRLLQRRRGSYRKEGVPGDGQDIATRLFDHIDNLAESRQANAGKAPSRAPGRTVRRMAQKTTRDREGTARIGSIVTRTLEGISGYFSRKHRGGVVQPQLSEKLEKSTWNHLHTALRHARQGKVTTARLHAEIANNAMKEAAHYMPEAQYAKFSAAVNEKLREILAQARRG